MLRLSALLMAFLAAGCAPEEPRDRDTHVPIEESAELTDAQREQRIDALVEAGRSAGTSETTIRQSLGEPDDVARRDTINPHTDDVDKVIRMVYAGVWFELYRVSASGEDLLMTVSATDPTLFADVPFSIGTPREEVEAHLGDPASVSHLEDGRVTLDYETLGIGAPMLVSFLLEGGALREIRWSFYVD
jgi:hypothetical protein